MNRLQRAGLKLNPAKCKLFQLKTKFIGHVICGRGIEPDPEKVRAVVDWPTLKNLTEARGFARPIHLLTQKNRPIIWEDTQPEAFEHLKQFRHRSGLVASS